MTYSQGTVSDGVHKPPKRRFPKGSRAVPERESAFASGIAVATVQLVLHVVGPEAQRLVQSRARHGPEFVKGHPVARDVQHPKRTLWSRS